MTGFVLSDTEVWGAHVGDAVARDESLFARKTARDDLASHPPAVWVSLKAGDDMSCAV